MLLQNSFLTYFSLFSVAFPTSDLIFEWRETNSFIFPENQMSTAQVRIVDWDLGDCTKSYADTGKYAFTYLLSGFKIIRIQPY